MVSRRGLPGNSGTTAGQLGRAIGGATKRAEKFKNRKLLAEVKRAHRNAGSKVSRFRRAGATGVEDVDPRRNLKDVNSYSAGRLRTYLKQLNGFNDRSTSKDKLFVQVAGGTLVPKARWERYKAAERAYNAKVDAINAQAKGFQPDGMGEVDSSAFYAAGGVSRIQPHQDPREPNQVTSADALQTLMDDLNMRATDDYRDERVGKVRETIEKLVEPFGDQDILDTVGQMTDYQLGLLWEYTQFASKLGLRYEGKSGNEGGVSDRARDKINEDAAEEARDILNRGFATYPRSAQEAAARRKGKSKS